MAIMENFKIIWGYLNYFHYLSLYLQSEESLEIKCARIMPGQHCIILSHRKIDITVDDQNLHGCADWSNQYAQVKVTLSK
jgi:hypothetical protein